MSGKNLIIQGIEEAQLKSDLPEFGAGDTVTVQVKVKEGTRERLQFAKSPTVWALSVYSSCTAR